MFCYPLLFDGAFGTYYAHLRGVDTPCELANLTDASTVSAIHGEYLRAGAQAIKTNTFGANTAALGLGWDDVRAVLRAGYSLACAQAGDAAVFADIGPIRTPPDGCPRAEYLAIADEFLALGARCFLLETFPAAGWPIALAAHIKAARPDAFIMASFAVDQDGFSREGVYFADILSQARACAHIDAVGLNCICGPAHMLGLVKRLLPLEGALSVLPNAGYPSLVNGRVAYIDNAAYFADKIAELAALGVPILGGCCGTTPAHIRLAAARLRRLGLAPPPVQSDGAQPAAAPVRPSPCHRLFCGEKQLIAVELDPPARAEWGDLTLQAQQLKAAGADILTVADSPLARARADSIMTAARLHREVGLPVLPHITCRDRNPLAMKAALLGAVMEGVQDALIVTGDPVVETERGVRGVFSFHSAGLMDYIGGLNRDVFAQCPVHYGGALNLNAVNFAAELARAIKKQQAGASFLLTQPAFSSAAIAHLRAAAQALDIPILLGLYPLAGYKNAVFLNNEVPGIQIPADVVESFYALTPRQARARALQLALELAAQAAPYCRGYYIMTPLQRSATVCRLIEEIRRNL
ncbi:MAG: bifunctional homocysteine S-methyltransferase/methylenetetrahydrofolate reductase [Eubacteriales bacterium]|nr:bifunctional homocysteine S-methyltransferase/methylenetetrahydrofolate reductase [Eubacteriales bacterium]